MICAQQRCSILPFLPEFVKVARSSAGCKRGRESEKRKRLIHEGREGKEKEKKKKRTTTNPVPVRLRPPAAR